MRRLVLLAGLAACGGDDGRTCGAAGDAGTGAATIAAAGVSAEVSGFRWGANNDCPAPGAQVVSVTISGAQTSPAAAGFGIGLCLPRPDRIGATPIDLGDATLVQLVGASSSVGGCTVTKGTDAKPSGSVTFIGFCTEAGATYELALSGQVAGQKSCGGDAGAAEDVVIQLAGRALVTPR